MRKHRYSSLNVQGGGLGGAGAAGGRPVEVALDVATEDFYSALQDAALHTPAQTRA